MEENIKIKVAHYKCFGENPQGFERIKPINILIGRNNSGKSSLIDVVEAIVNNSSLSISNSTNKPTIYIEKLLTERDINNVINKDEYGNIDNHGEFSLELIGKSIKISIQDNVKQFISIVPPFNKPDMNEFEDDLALSINPFEFKKFYRIYSERDIDKEIVNEKIFLGKGKGITLLLKDYLIKEEYPRELVEKKLLDGLNQIILPDSHYENFGVGNLTGEGESTWIIRLKEKDKKYIKLSDLGSGLKTIIMVLTYLLILPHKENKELKDFIFAFEELENNLHPALQRRLFTYIKEFAKKKKCTFFITTHSNVVIDLFSNDALCQIYHVQKIDENTICTPVKTYIEKAGILDDLDIRASDLLQANGIIWVEGPSDRIYINRWIELWSDGQFKEGIHYQCVFYGGRLLAHLTAETEENDIKNLINILKTNRNLMLLIDSDKKNDSDGMNKTKQRIKSELEAINSFCWITKGRTIENYIPKDALEKLFNKTVDNEIELYDSFDDYLKNYNENEAKNFSGKKVIFAERIRPYLNKENLEHYLDLNDNINKILDMIKKWNSL